MKSLITGGKGFIGSSLVRKLIKNSNDKIIVIDNNSSNNKNNFTIENVEYHDIDLKDFNKILSLFEDVDRVFHLAADISIDYCNKNPREAGINNSNITLNVLECCRLKNIKKFVFSSTSAVYKEKKLNVSYCENDETNPLNLYSASKLFGENLCKIYYDLYGIETTVLRYFNVYGPSMTSSPYASVMVKFLDCKKNDLPLNIYGDGLQTRDFIHVDDIADINIIASEIILSKYGDIFNVGSGNSITINDLAKNISDNLAYLDPKIGELKYSCADIEKLKKTFNWTPSIKVENWLKTLNM